jgi:hypothetical protein
VEVCLEEVPVVVPVEVAPLETIAVLSTEEKKLQALLLLINKMLLRVVINNQLLMKRLRRRKSLSPWVVASSIKPNWRRRRSPWLQLRRR